ncbi:CDF family Co(II)/Ni(II) efflux transporter DmeF [Pseudomonas luteola]|uniref:CDF family Co(II)/Ni(II) efflux transporter DmeF n=1 Tax=Pseudomonas luteola TaxID=47886 RepID=UPI00123948BA|nr:MULTISPECIES: CDF family Co(II)/Ni(II) efflux transporter DmeF [Pseudomonas]MBA1248781.1 CDF family Co(II)/Ni(II) efflux transporter DmeF [Pseudomonas zeshuii]QEU27685.1 CDF family Co(II)/Ni(II) efflux transporter DmeF [Pseudomonas luteola]
MSRSSLEHSCSHPHVFNEGNPLAEKNTRRAVIFTAIMMVIEIAGGWAFNSMALLADGWHMSSHVLALGLSLFAYAAARRYATDARFAFGTWKMEVLAGYTSALALMGIALLMLYESVIRLVTPAPIHYTQAIAIAILGLLVNLVCAWLLKDSHGHDHGHGHDHHGHGEHQDLNLRSAYIHVITDAATSVLAIVALIGGMLWGASWLDPVMGIVGGILVAIWAVGLIKQTGRVLLDAQMDDPVVQEVRDVIAESPIEAKICDLHVWKIGKGKYACIVSIATTSDASPEDFKQQLSVHEELVHITVEINRDGICPVR